MKTCFLPLRCLTLLGAAALLFIATRPAVAATYTDSVGDISTNVSSGNNTLDIVKMDVSDTASDVIFNLTVNGDITTTTWGNFMIGIANMKSNGGTNNGWGRPIRLTASTTNGMTHWIGGWVNLGGGAQLWTHSSGTNWSGPASLTSYGFYASTNGTNVTSMVSFAVSKTSLGVTNGNTIYFDAYSSGSATTDTAIDALSNPNVSVTSWTGAYTSSTTTGISSYLLNNSALSNTQSFTYTVENSKTTITGFSTEPSGSVTVPATLGGYTVTEIGRSAFKDRSGITSITFASGANVTKLGATAFQGCTGLTSIALPSGATTLPAGLLAGCTALTSVTIPSTVTRIGDSAFAGCTSLASLTLPSSLASLGESSFANCRSLTVLSIPSGVTVIPAQLFLECRALSSVSLPSGITSIGASAFYNCAALTSFSLPASVTTLGADAFHGCTGLTSFSINAALASMGSQAFLGCDALAAFTVNASNAVYSSLDGVLLNKAQTTLILCPEGKSGSYTIPSTVTALAEGAFAHCDLLTQISFSTALTSIADAAFYYVGALTTLSIPSSITSIGAWAFAGGDSLTTVNLSASVASLDDSAFYHASSLASAIFSGDAPAMGAAVFDSTASGFTVYYYPAASGFTSPTWEGYPSSVISTTVTLADWLTSYGLASDSGGIDSDGDGYANALEFLLGGNPTVADSADIAPKFTVTESVGVRQCVLTLLVRASLDSLAWQIQTSPDLETWAEAVDGEDGVTMEISDLSDDFNQVTVTFSTSSTRFFARVKVSGY